MIFGPFAFLLHFIHKDVTQTFSLVLTLFNSGIEGRRDQRGEEGKNEIGLKEREGRGLGSSGRGEMAVSMRRGRDRVVSKRRWEEEWGEERKSANNRRGERGRTTSKRIGEKCG